MLRTARPLTCLQSATQHVYRYALFNPMKTAVMNKSYTTIGAQRHLISKSTQFSWTASSKIVGVVSAATGTMSAGLWTKQPLHCEAMAVGSPEFVTTQVKDADAHRTLVRKGELSFGVFLGFCTGYLIKKVGKLFALMVGASFIFLQYLSLKGFITIHWDRLEGGYNRQLGVDKDGKVTTKAVRTKWNGFVGFLTHNLQFKSTFMVGLYGGIRYG